MPHNEMLMIKYLCYFSQSHSFVFRFKSPPPSPYSREFPIPSLFSLLHKPEDVGPAKESWFSEASISFTSSSSFLPDSDSIRVSWFSK